MTVVRVILWFAFIGADALPAATPLPADQQVRVQILETFTAPTSQPMHMPTDVAIDSSGRVYVADGANDRLVRFSRDHRWDGAITRCGDQNLKRPVGLTVDSGGRIWVADSGNHQALIIAHDEALIERIPLPTGPEHPFEPTDIAVTPDTRRAYIVDNDNHRLMIRNTDTGATQFVGRFGQGVGQFRWPFMICIDTENYVYVSEAIGARVQRLSPEDHWAGQVGRWGLEPGQLYRPKGVAITPRGQLLVSDSTSNVVQLFTTRGAFRGVLCDDSGQPFRFKHPMGMAFDREGRLYVVELKADRVAVVQLPPQWTASAPATQEAR